LSRGLKIVLGVIAGLIVLLVLNAIAVSNQTKDAELNVEGAEIVETSHGGVQVLDEGDPAGSPIVLIHCFTCSIEWWQKLAPLLADGHRVLSVDLLGHGGSDKPGAGYSIEDQAGAAAEALSSLGVQGAPVVGHSLGGTVATGLAEQSPQLASKVVLIDQAPDNSDVDTSLTQDLGQVTVIGQAMQRLVAWAPDSSVREQYEEAFAPNFNIASGFENPDQVVDDLREMTYTAFVDAADAENDFTDERPLNERLGAIGVPLLVIFGAEDQIYDAEPTLARYSDIPGVQTKLIEGAGHSPNVETPDQVAPLILSFAAPPAGQAAKKKAATGGKEKG
jgi:pimeloyl-ACP methyl ester carboxylesterase